MSAVYTRAEDVADELARRLTGITVAAGYETDIGSKLFRGRRKIPDDTEIGTTGVVFLIEGNDSPQDQQLSRAPIVKVAQLYELWAFGPCNADQPNVAAHAMIRDMKRAVWGGEPNLGGKVKSIIYRGRDIGPRPDGTAFVQAAVAFTVEYVESLATP